MIVQKFITVTTAMAAMLKMHGLIKTHSRVSLLLKLLKNTKIISNKYNICSVQRRTGHVM